MDREMTDLEKFAVLLNESGIDENLHPFFMNAAENRWAWKNDYLIDSQDITALINIFGNRVAAEGRYGWVGPRGEILCCAYCGHDMVARIFLGESILDVERKWARVTRQCNLDEAIEYVKRPTNAMRRGVMDVLAEQERQKGMMI